MEALYISIKQSVDVSNKEVRLGDICKMSSSDSKTVSRLKTVLLFRIKEEKYARYVVSALSIIEKIHEIFPQLDVVNLGEPSLLLTYKKDNSPNIVKNTLKIIFICVAAFFGGAFTIMTFNNDVGITDVFDRIYYQFTGSMGNGFTVLEISYSIGLAVGIVGFFNHIFGRKLSVDPTPLEVEMNTYETDVNTMLIDSCTREESIVDVS